MISIYITCKNKKEAQKIGLHLIKKRLAACCNIIPQIESFYWWRKKIVKDREAVLILHTIKKNFGKIEREIKKLHSYSIPLISGFSVPKVNREYLNWLKKEAKI